MNVNEAVASRMSCRAFLDTPVPGDTVRSILDAARRTPSGGNLQPWWVNALTGVSDAEIDYPKAVQPDILLCMNQQACDNYVFDLKADGVLIVDGTLVQQLPTTRAVSIPFTRIAREELKNVMLANIVALGALAVLTGIVSIESLEAAVLARVPKGPEEMNKKALLAGAAAGQKLLQDKQDQTAAPES